MALNPFTMAPGPGPMVLNPSNHIVLNPNTMVLGPSRITMVPSPSTMVLSPTTMVLSPLLRPLPLRLWYSTLRSPSTQIIQTRNNNFMNLLRSQSTALILKSWQKHDPTSLFLKARHPKTSIFGRSLIDAWKVVN